MPQHGFSAFQLIGNQPGGNKLSLPKVILRNKTNQLSGWRLNKAQYDFVTGLYEVDHEKK